MAKLFFFLSAFLVVSAEAAPKGLRAFPTTFEPCRSWNYDFQTNQYRCRQTMFQIRVYEANEVDNLVRNLERRIDDLERRLTAVEQKLP
jgi:hypothetical protein